MTTLVLRDARRAGQAGATRRLPARVDPLVYEVARLLAALVVVGLAFAGLAGLALTVGPIGIPPGGPTP